jgi:hypothetical protein
MITRRLALNALRKVANSQKAVDELWHKIEKFNNDTEESVLLHDLQRFTDQAVASLPPQQQLIFNLSISLKGFELDVTDYLLKPFPSAGFLLPVQRQSNDLIITRLIYLSSNRAILC